MSKFSSTESPAHAYFRNTYEDLHVIRWFFWKYKYAHTFNMQAHVPSIQDNSRGNLRGKVGHSHFQRNANYSLFQTICIRAQTMNKHDQENCLSLFTCGYVAWAGSSGQQKKLYHFKNPHIWLADIGSLQ